MKGIRVLTLSTLSFGVSSAYPSSTRPLHSVSVIPQRRLSLFAVAEEVDGLVGNLFFDKQKTTTPVERFFQAYNERDMDTAIAQFAEDCVYEDATFYTPFEGRFQLQRHLLLRRDATSAQYVIDDLAVSESKVGVKYHLELNGNVVPDSRHVVFYTMDTSSGLIQTCYDVVEPSRKTGQLNLAILTAASKIIGTGDQKVMKNETSSSGEVVSKSETEETGWLSLFLKGGSSVRSVGSSTLTPPERYFAGESLADHSVACCTTLFN
jgi:ketosteroid isomerase-like protein